MKPPTVHLICNAHLDPVWQWRWEEGCAEALSTFGTAVQLLHEHPGLIFNHNEAILYRWVLRYDPVLFKEIQKLAQAGRWCISGGWYLQPDANLPGTESLIRQITEGRRFFKEHFNAQPRVAYNFDSFGHSGGLPQLLVKSGYRMYIHMRPQAQELELPSDLYRWRGVDGSEVLTLRIAVGLYHTERDNIEQRIAEGVDLALRLKRDVPVFWGIGDHGGGPTREDLERIGACMRRERRVNVVHSSTEQLYEALKNAARNAPLVEGDLQRVFTGCYTSLSRIKRRSHQSLATLVQAEALRAASWRIGEQEYPQSEFDQAWRDHLFNDFHDIISGSCTQSAETDALDLYGRVLDTARRLRLGAAAAFNHGKPRTAYIPVTVLNANPSCSTVPVEVECMLDLRPKWRGKWHLRLSTMDGKEIPCQEEQPESLLPFNGWRRKVSFLARLPDIGAAHYLLDIIEGVKESHKTVPALSHTCDSQTGLVTSLDAGGHSECLAGPLLKPIVVEDSGDSWGTDRWSYRKVVGEFRPVEGSVITVENGPIRSITEAVLRYNASKITIHTIAYADWRVLEFRFRIQWNEIKKRLKLSIPTTFRNGKLLCEIPGGAIRRPADGEEHVHGRWLAAEGEIQGKRRVLAVVNNGQHGLDFEQGEIRLSVLRSAAYCHEQGFSLGDHPERQYMDQGVHDVRLLVTAGNADEVLMSLSGLADWLAAPPVAYSHLPIGIQEESDDRQFASRHRPGFLEFLSLHPQNVRLLACKRSWDGNSLIVRLQEATGVPTDARVGLESGENPLTLSFRPYEIRTLRLEKSGRWSEVDMIYEV